MATFFMVGSRSMRFPEVVRQQPMRGMRSARIPSFTNAFRHLRLMPSAGK